MDCYFEEAQGLFGAQAPPHIHTETRTLPLRKLLATAESDTPYPSVAWRLLHQRFVEIRATWAQLNHNPNEGKWGNLLTGLILAARRNPFKHKLIHHLGHNLTKQVGRAIDTLMDLISQDGRPTMVYGFLEQWVSRASYEEVASTKQERRKSDDDWKANLLASLEGAAGRAHAIARIKPERLTPWTCSDNLMRTLPTVALMKEHHKWATTWTAANDHKQAAYTIRPTILPPITGDQIQTAAKAFKLRTTAIEGIYPRQIAHIAHQGREALAKLYQIVEQVGDFPSFMRLLLVRLLDKGTNPATYRCIMLYRTSFRIWAKVRQPWVKEWARSTTFGFFNNQEHRRIGEGMWRTMIRRAIEEVDGNPPDHAG